MIKIVYNEDEKIQKEMLDRDEPFIIIEMMEKFDRGRTSILKHTKYLIGCELLFTQQVAHEHYFINRKKLNPEEIVNGKRCIYVYNEEVSKKICDNYCKRIKGCSVYQNFKKS
jgi:hypothetical protein